jgi:hypothetical protein
VPNVSVVDGGHEDIREHDTDVDVDLCPQWDIQAAGACRRCQLNSYRRTIGRTDQIPIKAKS